MRPEQTNEWGIRVARRLGADDAIVETGVVGERMARFANNSITVTKNVNESGISVYLAKGGRRILGTSTNPEKASLERFVERLFKSMMSLPSDPAYVPLPRASRRYASRGGYDKRLETEEGLVAGFASQTIGAARSAGGKRVAGSVEASVTSHHILTTAGTEGSESSSKVLLNVRAFREKDESGHGLSCAATAGEIRAEEAGRRAGEHATRMRGAREVEGGTYQVLMSPTVAANLLALTGEFASAFSVEAGTSYLADKLGKRVASETLTIRDHGRVEGCLEARGFDDEGQPTQSTTLIEEGVLRSYIHNLSTAERFKTKTTGNAGIIEPGPWNIEVSAGDSSYDEMVRELRHGLVLTSNWYTRFKNYRTGEFSTVPRDGAYLVEGGEVKCAVKGIRVSDTLERMSSSVRLLSREREWIQWWEVDTPTQCPWLLVDGVTITRAYGEVA